MGHLRLGRLPRTGKWRDVVGLVGGGGSAAQVADATLDAAEGQFAGADPAIVYSVWLLTQLPDAAKSPDFVGALAQLGVSVRPGASASELASAVGRAVDEHLSEAVRPRSDVGEMARLAAVETLAHHTRTTQLGMFPRQEPAGPAVGEAISSIGRPAAMRAPGSSEDAQAAVARLTSPQRFGALARDFFARLTERVLTYYVSKELPLHVGSGQRFGSLDEQQRFQEAVGVHAHEAARIVEEFAGGWYSKARFEHGLTEERTEKFVAYAMKKMRGELRRGAT